MIRTSKFTLDNGLRVVHYPMENTRMVVMDVLYNVGSKDEAPDHTGFAHLFEHLMFGGSAHIPDYDTPCETAGGDNNAWTCEDVTNFYLTLPSDNIETGFWLESDRMNALSFSRESLRIQKKVVMEEFRERSNVPYGDSSRILRALAYRLHPYRWLTIGKYLSHISKTTREDVKNFFYHHYAPNNAILTLAGDISYEKAIKLTSKWFGKIPRREIIQRTYPQEPPQTAIRRKTVYREVPSDALYMAFHICSRHNPDYLVFDLITDLLANGASSRLPRHLIRERKLFDSIDAYVTELFEPGLLIITGRPTESVALKDAEEAVWEELELLKTDITEYEMEKVKNKFESQWIFSNMSVLNAATTLAYAEILGQDVNKQVPAYRSISKEDVYRVLTGSLIKSNCSVLFYKKK